VERQLKIINGVFTPTDGEGFSQDSSMPHKKVVLKLRRPGTKTFTGLLN